MRDANPLSVKFQFSKDLPISNWERNDYQQQPLLPKLSVVGYKLHTT